MPDPSQITYPGSVTSSHKNTARGPDRAPVRAWRSWGDRAMPAPKLRRRDELAWLFRERARPAADGPHEADAPDGRPTLDQGNGDNADRLLERLRSVHGEP